MAATYASSPPYYPTGIPPEGGTISKRVDRPDYVIDVETGCWVWQRARTGQGYAQVTPTPRHPKRREARGEDNPLLIVSQYAANEYWRRAIGPLAVDQQLRRTCENRLCVNPDHGEPQTASEKFARHHRGKSQLTWDDVREIRAGVKAGVKQDVFQRRFKIPSPTVSNIVLNHTWHDPEYEPGVEKECALPGCRKTVLTTCSRVVYCTPQHSAMHNWRLGKGYYEHEAERRAERRAGNAQQRAVERAWSLDAPVTEESATSLGELVAGEGAYDVTIASVEAHVIREATGHMTIEEAEQLSDGERRAVRLLLAQAGVTPPSVRHHVPVPPRDARRAGTPTPGPSRRTMPRAEQRIVESIERTAHERHEAWREAGHPNLVARLTGDLEELFSERRAAQAGTFREPFRGHTMRIHDDPAFRGVGSATP